MNNYIQVQELSIPIERKRIKNLYIRLDKNNQVKISAPYIMSENQIKRFVESKIDWIRKKQSENKKKVPVIENYKDGELVHLFGDEYVLKVTLDKREKVEVNEGEIIVHVKSEANVEKVYLTFLRKVLQEYLDENVPIWEKKMNLYSSNFYIRDMKSRWGTCNTKTHRICFALNLAKKNYDFIDYVICHEIAHIKVPNHGDNFKKILDTYYPNWKIIRKQRRN